MRPTLLATALVFIVALLLSVWHNDFPASYHPDEPAKVTQVLSGERNLHHPPLMLDAAAAVLRLRDGAPPIATAERAVQTGRWLSAFYLAAACTCLTWLAGFYAGPLAAVVAGCLLAGNTQAVLAGHFFKEDPLFVLGLSLTLLAGAYLWKFPPQRWLPLLALAAAAGFATATKYLGVLALLYATALELMAPRAATMRHPSWRLLALWLVAVGTTLLLSISSWWGRFPELAQALLEAGHTTQAGNEAVGARVPHGQFVGMFFIETPPLVLLGVALFCRRAWPRDARSIRTHFDRWLLLSAPFVLLLVFSFSAITAVRYFLPISVLLSCLGGCGLALGMQSASAWAHERWGFRPSVTTCAAVAVCGLFQLPALLSLERGFATDDRRALREFVSTQLPPDAVIATDSLAGLDAAPALRQRVLTRKAIAELGDLPALRAQGVTHVVVCWYDSRRYVDPSKHPARGTEAEFLRRRDFYLGLEKHARLLWHRDIAQPFPLRPGLSLYALDEK